MLLAITGPAGSFSGWLSSREEGRGVFGLLFMVQVHNQSLGELTDGSGAPDRLGFIPKVVDMR